MTTAQIPLDTDARLSINRRRIAAGILPPVALWILLFVVFGPLGYNPSDDGNVLAQTYRFLHGEFPHRDVIFARPMGSAILHLIDYAVPLPLFVASRLIGIAELVAYSYLFAFLIFGTGPTRWSVFQHIGAAMAALVNVPAFPPIGWYTTDGLLFIAIGSVLMRTAHENRRRSYLGLFSLGLAPLMKQSFFLAPLVGVMWFVITAPPHRRRQGLIAATVAAALPLSLYLLVMAVGGALIPFVEQVSGAAPVWGRALLDPFTNASSRLGDIASLIVVLVTSAALWGRAGSKLSHGMRLGLRSVVSLALIMPFLYKDGFALGSQSAAVVAWNLGTIVTIRAILARKVSATGIGLLLTIWMTSLSWGYPWPNRMAGTAVLMCLVLIWSEVRFDRRERFTAAAVIATVSVGIGLAFVGARFEAPFFDRPRSALTARLDRVAPAFGVIRTSPLTARYLESIKSCVDRYPARWTAVLPNNPGIYPALKLRNPFPIDWMLPEEIAGQEDRIMEAVRDLNKQGGFLVLFETGFSAIHLSRHDDLPRAKQDSEPFFYGKRLGIQMLRELRGLRIACGPFVGVHEPS